MSDAKAHTAKRYAGGGVWEVLETDSYAEAREFTKDAPISSISLNYAIGPEVLTEALRQNRFHD